jgi:magnesium transporter
VILKEVLTNCFNGFFLSIFGGIVILIINNDFNLSLVFAAAVIINFTMAGFLGAFIPLTLSRMRVDPATASGVFLTALTDMIGFFAFLGLASVFL